MLTLRSPLLRRATERLALRRAPAASHTVAFDTPLLFVTLGLLMFGVVMVYSASIALPDSPRFANYKPTHFLVRHAFAVSLGLTVALGAFAVPIKSWQRLAPAMFVFGLVLMVIVLIPGIGKSVYGARRWLSLYVLNLQPSELLKLFVVLYAADYTVRKQDWMHRFKKGFLPMAAVMGFIGLLLLAQPDMGAFVVIVAIAMGVLFLGGVDCRLFASLALTLAAVFASIIWFSPWRRARIFAYLDPFAEDNALGKGYQLSHSLIAFGRGEWFGVGLGGSVEKLHYLPEAHTDFLLAVVGEELGLVGVMVVIVLFYWLVRRCFEIGRQSIALDRVFAGLAAKGIGLWIGVQAFINMGVNLGLLPTKGLTLPFMSYGGSGILVNCTAIAILMRIDYENRKMMRGAQT